MLLRDKVLREMRKLATTIAAREGKKSQVAIGNVREILAILSDIAFERVGGESPMSLLSILYLNGKHRAMKREYTSIYKKGVMLKSGRRKYAKKK